MPLSMAVDTRSSCCRDLSLPRKAESTHKIKILREKEMQNNSIKAKNLTQFCCCNSAIVKDTSRYTMFQLLFLIFTFMIHSYIQVLAIIFI